MWLKWHTGWDPLIIKALFKCKFWYSKAQMRRLNSEVWIAQADKKSFSILPQIVQLSAHITQHLTYSDSVCMEAPTLTRPAEGVHLWISIWSDVILLKVLSLLGALKCSIICHSFLPCPAPSLRCLECGHRSTSALLQWASCPAHPLGDSSQY